MAAHRHQKLDEENTGLLREAALESSAQAVRQVRQHRLPLTVAVNGQLVEEAPDGTRVVKKELAASKLGRVKGLVLAYR